MSIPSPMGISLRCLMVFSCLSRFSLVSSAYAWRPDPASWEPRRPAESLCGAGEAGRFLPAAGGSGLLAEPEALDGGAIALEILPLEIVEQAAAAAHHLEEAAAAVMVLGVGLEVLGELRDPVRQECHLDLGRPGVALVDPVLFDDALFHFCGLRQSKLLLT